jgi:hypothetical protein
VHGQQAGYAVQKSGVVIDDDDAPRLSCHMRILAMSDVAALGRHIQT